MKEKLHIKNETGQEYLHEPLEATEHRTAEHQQMLETVDEHNHSLDKIQKSIHEVAQSAEELRIDSREGHEQQSQPVLGMQRELKHDAYSKTMRKVRSHLGPAERSFSKFAHNKTIDPISEVGSKTIGRPSGILGGGITAFIGSVAVLYMARRYGFEYNLTVFFLLLGVGFLVGLLIELALHVLGRKKT